MRTPDGYGVEERVSHGRERGWKGRRGRVLYSAGGAVVAERKKKGKQRRRREAGDPLASLFG